MCIWLYRNREMESAKLPTVHPNQMSVCASNDLGRHQAQELTHYKFKETIILPSVLGM